MAGAVDQMAAEHAGAGPRLHRLEHAGALIGAPILLARDEAGGHVDGAARNSLHFGGERARRAAAIPLQPALESGAGIFGAVDRRARCPAAICWRRSPPRDGISCATVSAMVSPSPSRNRSAVLPARSADHAFQRIRLVVFPVRALVMVIGAQEIMHALRRAVHVGVGLARRIVPLVMLARPRQRGEFAMHGIFGRGLCGGYRPC